MADHNWNCEVCTYNNADILKACEMCETPRRTGALTTCAKKMKMIEIDSDDEESSSKDSYCCPECRALFDSLVVFDEHMQLHELQAQEQLPPEFRNRDRGEDFMQQYERNIRKAVDDCRVGRDWMEKRLDKIRSDPRALDDDTRTYGIIEQLEAYYKANQTTSRETILCSPTDHYSTSYGDRGWGCGYRNIQMLLSSLLGFPELKKALLGGLGHVPMLPAIQEWLEAAWSAGYDEEGRKQLSGSVFGTKKWIGTTECACFFRQFGVRLEIATFAWAPGTKAVHMPKKMKQTNRDVKITSSSTAKHDNAYPPNQDLVGWVWNYFKTAKTSGTNYIAPLYLQHAGHSRTIVGVEKNKDVVTLLIFDPSIWGRKLPDDIKNGKLGKIRRTLQSMTRPQYEICFVRDLSLYGDNERQASKNMYASEKIESRLE